MLEVCLNLVVHKKPLTAALDAPRYHQQAIPEELLYESKRATKSVRDGLNAMGHGLAPRETIGDVHAILFENGRLIAVADSRRGGAAGGY